MKIFSVTSKNVYFGRKPTKEEASKIQADCQEAKNFLGIKNQALILHGSSFPVSNQDLFIGSPVSKQAVEINKFCKMFGYDSIQLGPSGLLLGDTSPYGASSTSENYLFTDMSKLATPEYGNILSMPDIKGKVNPEYVKNSNRTDFKAAFSVYDKLFEKAYNNFKSTSNDATKKDLTKEFEEYKQKNSEWLDSDSMFSILEKKFQTNNFSEWPEEYQNLNLHRNNKNSEFYKSANEKYNAIAKENESEIDLYKFKQFIIKKQEKAFLKANPDKLKYIGDNTIGMSFQTVFAHPEAFLKNFRVGCPSGGCGESYYGTERGANQLWDIPVLNPKTIFNEDGSLGIGGKLLRQKISNLLDFHQNLRIDHALGLVDPWIYDKSTIEIKKDANGKILYTGAVGANINKCGKENAFSINGDMPGEKQAKLREINEEIAHMPKVDPNGDYPKILEKIIMPLLKEKNINPQDLVWENLGTMTDKFEEIYNQKCKLPGISNITWDRGQYKNPEDTYLVTSHDDDTFTHIATNNFYNEKKNSSMNPDFLIGWLYPDKNEGEKNILKENLSWDTQFRVKTMYQELFRCAKKLEVSFMDFFGLDKRYNTPGTSNAENWTLRLTKDFDKKYYDALEKRDWQHHPINIPEMYERAVISKAYTENYANEADKANAIAKARTIADKMSHWKNVLYEKTVGQIIEMDSKQILNKVEKVVEDAVA